MITVVVRCNIDGCGAEESTEMPSGTEWIMYGTVILFPRKAPLNKPCITNDGKHFCVIKGQDDLAKVARALFKAIKEK